MRKFDKLALDAITRVAGGLVSLLDPEPGREGLRETPARVAKAWEEWTSGYDQDPQAVIKAFADGGEGYDEMVVVKDIPFYSHCEHHMAPIIGTASVGYLPNGKILGLSKMPRIVEIYARRLQVQERMTSQIAQALNEGLSPKGVGVVVRARHMCMESRGVRAQGTFTVTSSLLGNFREGTVRSEFLELVR